MHSTINCLNILYYFNLFYISTLQLLQIFFLDNLVPRFWLAILINRFIPFVEQEMPFKRCQVLTLSTSLRLVVQD